MSFTFDTSKAQANTTSAGDAAAVAALPNFSFGAAGAGDAGKAMPTGLNAMATPMQNKPGGLFSTGLNTPPTQNTGFSFGTPAPVTGIGGATVGTPVVQPQSAGLSFNSVVPPNTGITFGTANTAAPTGFSAAAPAGFSAGVPTGFSAAAPAGFSAAAPTGFSAAAPAGFSAAAPAGFSAAAPAGFSAAAPAGFSAAAPAGFSAAVPAGFSTAAPAGFSAAAPVAAPGFNLGGPIAAAAAPAPGLTFGPAKPATSTGFSLGGGEAPAPAGGSGLTFGTPNVMTTGTGYNLGSTLTTTTASTTTTTASGFGLGSGATTTTVAGIPLDSAKTSTVQTGFSLAPTTATLQPNSGFGTGTANTTAAATGFPLTGTGTTSAATGFSFGGAPTATTASGFALDKTVSGAVPSSLAAAPTTQISLGTTTTVSSSASGTQPAAINFFQLEESINKWTLELEEQEKVFVNQASQINAWDKLLITNGEKIVTLNQEVERVKIEQQQLEHELDYVVGQQKELQDCLVPLEKELASLSVSDSEREYTYRLAENLDTQLKQMSEDLKEIIEHLNEANRTQDSSDPIVQIGKILNAHMNSLQWLDQQTTLLSSKIQQIDQMHQNFRQENERSFNLAYN